MANNLDPQKEEEIKILLKTYSIREIIKKIGVAGATVRRIRNENFTEKERVVLKKLNNVRGRHKRELGKMPKEGKMSTQLIEKSQEGIKEIEKERSGSSKEGREVRTKICKKYGPPHEKPLSEFGKNASTPDGFEYACKACLQKYRQEMKKRKAEKEGGDSKGKRDATKTGFSKGFIPERQKVAKKASPSLGPEITNATPEEIIKALRRGTAMEIMDMIRNGFEIQ